MGEAHFDALAAAFALDREGRNFTYFSYAPFPDVTAARDFLGAAAIGPDPLFATVLIAGQPAGILALMRLDPASGVFEIGQVHFSPLLQRTTASTEAVYLLLRHMFDDLGYRRAEWKCDTLNAPSRAAAERLGFQFEGIFRQAIVTKSRNRDTAWYSIIDREWPEVKGRLERWLAPENFDELGNQRQRLGKISQRNL